MTNQQKPLTILSLVAVIINIGLNALLIPKYGIGGAAFASMISMATYQAIIFARVKKIFL